MKPDLEHDASEETFNGRADWWEASLSPASSPRAAPAVRTFVLVAGVVVAQGVLSGCVPEFYGGPQYVVPPSAPGVAAEEQVAASERSLESSLVLQQAYGWNFGASNSGFRPTGAEEKRDPAMLNALAPRLAPSRPDLLPYYVPTLFDSVELTGSESDRSRLALRGDIYPIRGRDDLFTAGGAIAHAFLSPKTAIVVDLPGGDSVAYAAGLVQGTPDADPVFVFDNWPHPFGVVRSEVTLETVLHYLPVFEHHAASPSASPVFVLDSARLNPYANMAGQFDNRYVARLPSADDLRTLGIERVIYVSAYGGGETDDLNDIFVTYSDAGIEFLRIVPYVSNDAMAYQPERRRTIFDSGAVAVRLYGFGMMPIVSPAGGGAPLLVVSGGSFGRGGVVGGG